MNIGEEKEHIYSLMREVTQERRKLTEIYFSLKARLDDLSRLEEKGLDNLSLTGYVDLRNKVQREVAVSNIKRETDNIIANINSESENFNSDKSNEVTLKVEEKAKEEKNARKTKVKQSSYEMMLSTVSNVLKEHGIPLSLAELYDKVNDKLDVKVTRKNFSNNIMYRIVKDKNSRIERARYGFYQYIM